MKRLNPDTGKPFVRGDTRADGFLFSRYKLKRIKKDGFFGEQWLSPDAFDHQKRQIKVWFESNPEKSKANSRKTYESNKPRHNAYCAKRHAAKLQRTPPWLTKEHYLQIECIYEESKRLTIRTGIVHHVDHIVPLQGKTVSGLHVPWNLRAIPATENMSKHNSFQVE